MAQPLDYAPPATERRVQPQRSQLGALLIVLAGAPCVVVGPLVAWTKRNTDSELAMLRQQHPEDIFNGDYVGAANNAMAGPITVLLAAMLLVIVSTAFAAARGRASASVVLLVIMSTLIATLASYYVIYDSATDFFP